MVGSALNELENPPEDYIVHGPNRMTSLPMELPVTYQDVAHCIEKSISKIEAAVLSALDTTPPELYADIVRNGIYLTVEVRFFADSTSASPIRSVSLFMWRKTLYWRSLAVRESL